MGRRRAGRASGAAAAGAVVPRGLRRAARRGRPPRGAAVARCGRWRGRGRDHHESQHAHERLGRMRGRVPAIALPAVVLDRLCPRGAARPPGGPGSRARGPRTRAAAGGTRPGRPARDSRSRDRWAWARRAGGRPSCRRSRSFRGRGTPWLEPAPVDRARVSHPELRECQRQSPAPSLIGCPIKTPIARDRRSAARASTTASQQSTTTTTGWRIPPRRQWRNGGTRVHSAQGTLHSAQCRAPKRPSNIASRPSARTESNPPAT